MRAIDSSAQEVRERYQRLYGAGHLSLSANYSDKWERFFAWLEERVKQNRALIEVWVAPGALAPVPPSPPLRAIRPDGVDDAVWPGLEGYLTYDGWREPWYSEVAPVCYYGASAIYFLRKGPGEGR